MICKLAGEIIKHVFIVGSKSLGAYGGYETFVNKLKEYHQNNEKIKYHVACKANGDGCMDESTLDGVEKISVTASAGTLYDDARLTVVDSVLIDLEPENPVFKDTVNLFHVMGVEVNISLADYNLGIPNQQIIKMGDLTVLSRNGPKEAVGDLMAKRALDIVGGLVGILLTGILTLLLHQQLW